MKKIHWFAIRFLGIAAVGAMVVFVSDLSEGAAPRTNSCVECHKVLPGRLGAPVKKFQDDIHAERNLTCVDCHGGDSSIFVKAAKAKETGFIGIPKPRDIPVLCNKCHGDESFMRRYNPSARVGQMKAYEASIHGMRLAKGDAKVATCSSCHSAHGILPAKRSQSSVYPANVSKTCGKCHGNKEYMKGYKIPTDQAAEYAKSIHSEILVKNRDFSAPTCNNCHGNHGAFPPDVHSVSDMCGQCHVNNKNLFEKSRHKKIFGLLRIPECSVCHSNHNVRRANENMVGGSPPALCVRCHQPGTKQIREAVLIRKNIEALKFSLERADEKLADAERKGMEVSEDRFKMKDVQASLIKSRTLVHSFSSEVVGKETAKAVKVADEGYEAALAAIRDFHSRRQWVIWPIVVTIFLAVLLYLKLRQIEGRY